MTTYRLSCAVGDIVMRLHEDRAPLTCANFRDYLRLGYLRPATFYRILGARNQAMHPYPVAAIQGGVPYDPAKGYEPDKGLGPIPHESTALTGLRHRHGTVSMGRFAPGQTYGGFCIGIGDQPELDSGGRRFPDGQGAAAFGQVIAGLDVLQALSEAAEDSDFLTTPIPIASIVPID